MAAGRKYHHGNLREALLDAGLVLLTEKGADGFSLRACAARANVSHAAPAHHFGDIRALLSALAARGFTMFADRLRTAREEAGNDAGKAMQAVGLAYIAFARENPAIFKLMFDGQRLDWENEELASVARQAYGELETVAGPASRRTGPAGPHTPALMETFLWSLVHGYAHLSLAGQLSPAGEHQTKEEEARARSLLETVSNLMLEG